MTITEIRQLVLECLALVLEERDGERPALTEATRLLGRDAVLDSLGLVTLIVDVEDRLRSQHRVVIALADDSAMSRTRSPFLTVESFSQYISGALEHRAR